MRWETHGLGVAESHGRQLGEVLGCAVTVCVGFYDLAVRSERSYSRRRRRHINHGLDFLEPLPHNII